MATPVTHTPKLINKRFLALLLNMKFGEAINLQSKFMLNVYLSLCTAHSFLLLCFSFRKIDFSVINIQKAKEVTYLAINLFSNFKN